MNLHMKLGDSRKFTQQPKEKYCPRCHKYHPSTAEHWHPSASQPRGLGYQCRHFVPKPKHPKLTIAETPPFHKALEKYLSSRTA